MKTHIKKILLRLLTITCLSVAVSCDSSYLEFDQLPDLNNDAVFLLPLVNSDISIDDIIPDEDNDIFVVGADHQISLVFNERVLSVTASEFYEMPEQTINISAPVFSVADLPVVERTLEINTGMDDRLDSVRFSAGNLFFQLSSPALLAAGHRVTAIIVFPEVRTSIGQPLRVEVPLTPTANSRSVSLANVFFPFHSVGNIHNNFDMEVQVRFDVIGPGSNGPFDLNFTTQFSGLKVHSVAGIIAPRSVALAPTTMDLPMFGANFYGMLDFENPRVSVTGINNFGIPVSISASQFFFTKDATRIDLTGLPNPWNIGRATQQQVGTRATFHLNRNNSNISQALALRPSSLTGAFNISASALHEKGFLLGDSRFEIQLDAELPLHLRSNGFRLIDTLSMGAINPIDQLQELELIISVANEIPLQARLQVVFLDNLMQNPMTLFPAVADKLILPPATVDATGRVTGAGIQQFEISLSNEQIQALYRSRFAILTVNFITSGQGNIPIRILNTQEVSFKAGVRATVRNTISLNR